MRLSEALDERRNALNVIRLALAVVVIVDHVPLLGGFGKEPRIGQTSIGSMAVAGFFGISGYLIAQSRTRSTTRRYIWHRFLRIYPGALVCLLVVAFVFAPLAWWHIHGTFAGYDGVNPLRYVAQNAPLVLPRIDDIPGTLDVVPQARAWNTPLWTLQWEIACYAVVLLLARLGCLELRRRSWVVALLGAFVVLGVVESAVALPLGGALALVARFGATFLAGTVLFLYAERVRFDGRLAAVAAVAVVAGSYLPRSHALTAVPLAYACLWLGARWRTNWCRRIDLSYGVYIYSFPVQQALALWGIQRHGPELFFVASVVGTIPLALTSFLLVERPAMRLRHWRRAPAGDAPALESLAPLRA